MLSTALFFERKYLDLNRRPLEILSTPIPQEVYGGMVRFPLNDPYLLDAVFIECRVTDEYLDFPGQGLRVTDYVAPAPSTDKRFTSGFRNPVKFGRFPADLSLVIDGSMAGTQLYFTRRYLDVNRQLLEILCTPIPQELYGGMVRFPLNDNYLTAARFIECSITDNCNPQPGQGPRVNPVPYSEGPQTTAPPTTFRPQTTQAPTTPPPASIPPTTIIVSPPTTTILPTTTDAEVTTLPETTIPETTRPPVTDIDIECEDLIEIWSVKSGRYIQVTLKYFKQRLALLDCDNATTTPQTTLAPTTAPVTTQEVTTAAPETTAGPTTAPPTTLETGSLSQSSVTAECGVKPTFSRDKALGSITADLVVEFYGAESTIPYRSISQTLTLSGDALSATGTFVYATNSAAGDRYRVFIRGVNGAGIGRYSVQQNQFFRALLGCGQQTTQPQTTQITTFPPTTFAPTTNGTTANPDTTPVPSTAGTTDSTTVGGDTTDVPTTQPGTTQSGTTQPVQSTQGEGTTDPGTTQPPTSVTPATTQPPTTVPPTTDASGFYYRIKPGSEICLEDDELDSNDFDPNDFE